MMAGILREEKGEREFALKVGLRPIYLERSLIL